IKEKDKIGAYTFSYCLENKRHDNLPNFILTMLIISDHPNPKAFGRASLEHINSNFKNFNPKYISLLFTKKNKYSPIFMMRNLNKIKIKVPHCDSCGVNKKWFGNKCKISTSSVS